MGKTTWTILVALLLAFYNPSIAFAQKEAGSSAATVKDLPEATVDRRASVLKAYLEAKNSPLNPSAATFIKTADKYNLDWKLVVAISGVESTFGQQIPYNSYNAWGWGIYGDNTIRFSSWDEGIETISKGLREKYMDKWEAQNVYQIGQFYAASPTWAQRVDSIMRQIDSFAAKDTSSLSISL